MGGVIQALRLMLLLNGLNGINTNWERKQIACFLSQFYKKDALKNVNLYILVS